MAYYEILGVVYKMTPKNENFESVVDYTTKLENFEGPLDLLLFLVKDAKIEIRDIFVSEVTEQFLEYIKNVDKLDIEKAGDYLNMAATLLEIKSKALLPAIEIEDDYCEEDPQETLFRQLEEYKIFKEASEKLKGIENTERFYKDPDESATDVKVIYKDFNLQGLIKAFTEVLSKADLETRIKNDQKEIPKEVFTVADKIIFIKETMLKRISCSFYELFTDFSTKSEIITTFQAMLELLKHQYIKAEQNGNYEDITITLCENRSEELGDLSEYN